MTETHRDNAAWADAAPTLSVLVPFMRDDPVALIAALGRETAWLAGAVELVLLDDGGDDASLADRVYAALAAAGLPGRLVRLAANQGRAKGRNRLAAHARAGHLLFLDADMLPDDPHFLRVYLDWIARQDPPVVFGGFSVDQAPDLPKHALHRRMALHSDCLPAAVRALRPEKYIFTSNLLIRRDVFDAEAFDETFTGWGWEDVEWGIRIGRRWPILHIDNAATHLGLDTAPTLIRKYRQSVANFALVAAKHPDVVSSYPSYRAARLLRRVPLFRLGRPVLALIARLSWLPVASRAYALRLYRTALYADAI